MGITKYPLTMIEFLLTYGSYQSIYIHPWTCKASHGCPCSATDSSIHGYEYPEYPCGTNHGQGQSCFVTNANVIRLQRITSPSVVYVCWSACLFFWLCLLLAPLYCMYCMLYQTVPQTRRSDIFLSKMRRVSSWRSTRLEEL